MLGLLESAQGKSKMKALQDIEKKFNKLSMREKILVIVVIFVLIYIVMDRLIIQSNLSRGLASMEEWQNQKIAFHAINAEMTRVKERIKSLPAVREKKMAVLEGQIQALNSQILVVEKDLINPKDMIEALTQIFSQKEAPEIVTLRHLGFKSLGSEEGSLYQHQFELTFKSNYGKAIEFFEKLKGFEKPFFLDSVSYEVIAFPEALITVKFYSLSKESTLLVF
ncbi:MAG: hypothetical protein U1E78_07410 [Gammaproteobacteria bacterium]